MAPGRTVARLLASMALDMNTVLQQGVREPERARRDDGRSGFLALPVPVPVRPGQLHAGTGTVAVAVAVAVLGIVNFSRAQHTGQSIQQHPIKVSVAFARAFVRAGGVHNTIAQQRAVRTGCIVPVFQRLTSATWHCRGRRHYDGAWRGDLSTALCWVCYCSCLACNSTGSASTTRCSALKWARPGHKA